MTSMSIRQENLSEYQNKYFGKAIPSINYNLANKHKFLSRLKRNSELSFNDCVNRGLNDFETRVIFPTSEWYLNFEGMMAKCFTTDLQLSIVAAIISRALTSRKDFIGVSKSTIARMCDDCNPRTVGRVFDVMREHKLLDWCKQPRGLFKGNDYKVSPYFQDVLLKRQFKSLFGHLPQAEIWLSTIQIKGQITPSGNPLPVIIVHPSELVLKEEDNNNVYSRENNTGSDPELSQQEQTDLDAEIPQAIHRIPFKIRNRDKIFLAQYPNAVINHVTTNFPGGTDIANPVALFVSLCRKACQESKRPEHQPDIKRYHALRAKYNLSSHPPQSTNVKPPIAAPITSSRLSAEQLRRIETPTRRDWLSKEPPAREVLARLLYCKGNDHVH